MNDKHVLLKTTALTKDFDNMPVLKGIDLELCKGDVVAIIGPSGCGKSTFLRCLNLLEKPTSGEIVLAGEQLFWAYSPLTKQQIKDGRCSCEQLSELKAIYKTQKAEEKSLAKKVDKNINLYREKMGMVFQQFNLFNNLTVLENITLAPVHLKKASSLVAFLR